MSQELFKANQIIKKLQDELHAQLNKVRPEAVPLPDPHASHFCFDFWSTLAFDL